ncbi:MAG: ABC transporter ATP-binding protein [Deltaproteobacteria bacterium]|nr:ABC transporter ATP-binding protein [Deltaproteobacteria bacterium]
MKPSAIRIDSLVKTFPKGFWRIPEKIIDGVSFEVHEGEAFGLVGHNGAGKTTLLKCLVGLLRPNQGKVLFFGDSELSVAVKQKIGFLPEQPYFYDYLTGEEFLHLCANLFGIQGSERSQRVTALLEKVGLAPFKDRLLRSYSKGMLQRIGIAQALINQPPLLILDEPMSGLDPVGRKEIRDLILDLKRRGTTILLSSHILYDVEVICDRIGFLVAGKMTYCGPLKSLMEGKVKAYEVWVSGVEPQRLQKISGVPVERSVELGEWLVRMENLNNVNVVIDDIRKNGGKILSLTPVRESLEEIYSEQVRSMMK